MRSRGQKKTPPQRCGGRFAWRHSTGRAAKGAISEVKSVSAACGGVFAWQRSRTRRQRALPAAVAALSRTEKRPRSDAGAFCVTTFAGQNGKARCLQRSDALAGGKTSPQQPHRSLWQKKRPRSSRTALSGRKNAPTARGNAFSACPALMGGATQPAAPGLTSGEALVPLRPPPFPRPLQRAGPGASPPAARACTGRQRRRWPAGGRRTSGGCRNGFA